MLYKKILSLFESKDGFLDFDLFAELCENSELTKENILELDDTNLNLLLKLLIDNKQFKSFSNVIAILEKSGADTPYSMIALALIKRGVLNSTEDFKQTNSVLENLGEHSSLALLPFIKNLPEKVQKKIELSLSHRRSEVNEYREELKEQIDFLKTQMLTEKAIEIEDKLKFHFPGIEEQFLSAEKTQSKNNEQKFAKIIERNLSFSFKSQKTESNKSSVYEKNKKDESEQSLELAKIWFSEMKDENLDLLLTQLEFLNFEHSGFFSDVLKESSTPDVWTKLVLFIKSKRYLEGLDFLEENEQKLLTESPESVYNYYYTKGLLFLGAGMNKEAEEIFLVIKEQKENFRDIKALLQNAK